MEQTSGRIKAVLTVLDEPFEDMTQDELETIRQRRLSLKGSMKGKIRMSDDFDEPLEEMKEYME
ncbi:MAG: DUF2281 domain-containing protein [Defluviitaleaceae bacterium]|nr:DUF2281 domain-containing protein [Defluviitaleaceae bacterium]